MGNLSCNTCPRCGAPLPPAAKGKTVCEYCGSTVSISSKLHVNDARQFGQDFELGRYDAQNSIPGTELAKQIKDLIEPLEDIQQTIDRVHDLESKKNAAAESLGKIQNTEKAKPVWVSLLVFILSSAFFLESSGSIIFSLALAVITFFYLRSNRNKNIKALERAVSNFTEKYEDACDHLTSLYDTYNFDLIPEDYQQTEAMAFFVKVLKNGRAVSLTQAINLYEEDKHRKQLLKLQAEQNKLQAQQIKLQKQHLEEQREFHEEQLEQAKQKKSVDWGNVLTAAGSVAAVALTTKHRKR